MHSKIGIVMLMEPHTNDILFTRWYLNNNINLIHEIYNSLYNFECKVWLGGGGYFILKQLQSFFIPSIIKIKKKLSPYPHSF